MDITKVQIIQIDWEGPYHLADLPKLNNKAYDFGIYQIYGKHPVYGKDVLLYIGQTSNQTLGKRIAQENWLDTNDSNNSKVYVGTLHGAQIPSKVQWTKEIDLAERFLIYVHKPAYNARSVSSFPDKELQDIHILNWGNYRDLLPEISGLRYTSKLDDWEYHQYSRSCE